MTREWYELKGWFDTEYTKKEQKFRRLEMLGKLTDEGEDPHNKLIELYQLAEVKRKRIQELETF